MAPPDFKSGREAETSPVGSIPSRFRHMGGIPAGVSPAKKPGGSNRALRRVMLILIGVRETSLYLRTEYLQPQ